MIARRQPRGRCSQCGRLGMGQWTDSGRGSAALRVRTCVYCAHQIRAALGGETR